MGRSFVLCGSFEITKEPLQPINSGLSFLLIQGIKMLLLKFTLVVWRRDYWIWRFLTKDIIVTLLMSVILYIT